MKHNVRLLIPLLLISISCSPSYQVFTQQAAQPIQLEGETIYHASTENDQVELKVTAEKSVEDLMAYEVYVKNTGDKDILIDPTSFYVEPLHLNGDPVAYEERSFRHHAYAADEHLQMLEKRMKKYRSRFTGYQIMSFFVKTATIVAMGTAESQSDWNWLNVALALEDGADFVVGEVHYNNMNDLFDRADEWEKVALNTHSISPGEESWGIVLFQIQPAAGLNRLHFPLGDEILFVDFKQNLHLKKGK
ncbi:MAG: hypothetical protein AAFR66_10820 [Bacteroidota bacterium]